MEMTTKQIVKELNRLNQNKKRLWLHFEKFNKLKWVSIE